MFSIEVFLMCLLVTSTLTGFTTEAIKTILTEYKVTYRANTLAGLVAFVLSAVIGVGYVIMIDGAFTTQVIVSIVSLTFTSWLCSMVGYDKVIQAITQFQNKREDD